jgi:23S rRNA (guanosine2251-2'-O)-methyltransferase
MGAIARSAECAGVHAIIVPEKGSAQMNGDAMKTSAGALNYIPVCRVKSIINTVKYIKDCGIEVMSATEKADMYYFNADMKKPVAIIMGSEDIGINPDLLRLSDLLVKIPMKGQISSLNVSAATSAILFEAVRQRV